ncbi:hypothetical protein D3C85_1935600 [compost metagenome]
MTTKNSIDPRLLAATKMLMARIWVLAMKSAVPWMLRVSMAWRRRRSMRSSLAPSAMAE